MTDDLSFKTHIISTIAAQALIEKILIQGLRLVFCTRQVSHEQLNMNKYITWINVS
jgi:hypothetical protein